MCKESDMSFREKISVLGMYLALLAGSMTYSVIIVWCFVQVIPLEVVHRRILVGVVYLFVVVLAVRFYIPKFRKYW